MLYRDFGALTQAVLAYREALGGRVRVCDKPEDGLVGFVVHSRLGLCEEFHVSEDSVRPSRYDLLRLEQQPELMRLELRRYLGLQEARQILADSLNEGVCPL
jgi:hypothetical protein